MKPPTRQANREFTLLHGRLGAFIVLVLATKILYSVHMLLNTADENIGTFVAGIFIGIGLYIPLIIYVPIGWFFFLYALYRGYWVFPNFMYRDNPFVKDG